MDSVKQHVSVEAAANIERWLTELKYDEYKVELEQMIANEQWQDLEDAFFKVIEFGTGGRRGTTGVGSNRINRVTIGESAQALCRYAQQFDPDAPAKGVVIACDTRLTSPELSQYTARVCAANGFKTYIFDSFRATPELSFAVRHLGCAVGIVISASHNPPTDNGFKAYWDDGAQVVPPHDRGILDAAAAVTEVLAEPDFDAAVTEGKITIIGQDVDEAYYAAVLAQADGQERDLTIAYSPLHGAGQTNVLPVLRRAGFTQTTTVDEQMVPDGNFPTIANRKPNPEERAANDMVVAKMMEISADIAITNDPDADRIGVIVNHHGQPIYLTGNQSAALATDYALRKLQERGGVTPQHYIVKTIVTTDMMKALADSYGATCYGDLLIGFKYIGEVIRQKEGTDEVFVLGGEESYGLLKGDYARDKDGAVGALALAEYAAELKQQGKTLVDRLMELYREVGLYVERLEVAIYPGAEGFATMQQIMNSLRTDPPKMIGDQVVSAVSDYQTLVRTAADGTTTAINCVKGNVLVFECGDSRRRITIRPSGTEPKLKFYIQWHEETTNPEEDYTRVQDALKQLFEALQAEALNRVQ